MRLGKALLLASLTVTGGCSYIKPLGFVTLPPDLAVACDDAYPLAPGDNWETAAIENKARLLDCGERHKATVAAVQG